MAGLKHNHMFNAFSMCAILTFVNFGAALTYAQSDVPEAWVPAIEKINEESVTKTIKYLASDEMAGRDTPSKELDEAGKFVADRFREAGLVGGGKEGSFFLPAEIATVTHASKGIVFLKDGKELSHFGQYSVGNEALEYDGEIKVIDLKNQDDSKLTGPVAVDVPTIDDRREQFMFMRSLRSLFTRGATAILLMVDEDNPMTGVARKNLSPQIIRSRQPASGHYLLISKDSDLSGKIKLRLPAAINGKSTVNNVIGVLRGSDPKLSEEAIIITAHLDHVGTTPGLKDPIFNGADDDATGVTGVLTLADAFGALKTPPKRTLIFMTFWGEEKGLLGSRHYCENPSWPLDKVVANVNLEMIGRPEPGANEKAWMTGWDKSDLGTIMADGAKVLGIEIFEHPQHSARLYGASDNMSFVQKGVVAHSFSAGSLHEDYHQPGDEWEKLSLKHMTRVIQGLFAGIVPIAEAKVTPAAAK